MMREVVCGDETLKLRHFLALVRLETLAETYSTDVNATGSTCLRMPTFSTAR